MYVEASNYPCANYFVSTSSNNGSVFNTPIQVNDGACAATVNFEGLNNMTIAPDGTVHAIWVDARRPTGNGDIYTARSVDNGQNFGTNIMVNSLTSVGVDAQQFYPSIAVDADDNVYVSFTDMRLGTEWEDHRAYLAVSVDGGDSFAEETPLADLDNDLCKYHKLGVSENGELVAVVLSSAGMPDWGVYHLVSQDGGATFSAPFNISDVDGDAPNELSIVVTSDGTTHAVWADKREGMGVTNLYYSNTTNITSIGSENDKVNFRFYPNPTAGELNLILEGTSTEGEIILTDIQGRVVFRNSIPNMNQFALNFDVPQGLYTITLSTPTNLYTSQLMVIK